MLATPYDQASASKVSCKKTLLSQISPIGGKSVWTIKAKLIFIAEDGPE
uniref:MATH domain-containing protein n=1 Tax=Heterorhabditis bacteriophora TaxID=37862 RepID=A0A1I7WUN4_HETBA